MIIMLHVALCLYVFIAPDQALPRNKLIDVYRQLVVLGPFFTDSGIKYSHYFIVRFKRNDGSWSPPHQFGKEHFAGYCNNPLRWDKLSYVGYERQMTSAVATLAKNSPFEIVQRSSAFRELNEFVTQELITEPVDSVQLIYGLDYFRPESKSYWLDTVFAYTYNPNFVAKAKK